MLLILKSQHSPRTSEENHENVSGYPASWPRYEPGTSRIRTFVRSIKLIEGRTMEDLRDDDGAPFLLMV